MCSARVLVPAIECMAGVESVTVVTRQAGIAQPAELVEQRRWCVARLRVPEIVPMGRVELLTRIRSIQRRGICLGGSVPGRAKQLTRFTASRLDCIAWLMCPAA